MIAWIRNNIPKRYLALLFALLSLAVFLVRMQSVLSFSYPVGWDSFFYLTAMKQFHFQGDFYFHVHQFSIALWSLGGTFFHIDEVKTYNLIVLLSLFAIGVAICRIGFIFELGVFSLCLPIIVWSSNFIFRHAYDLVAETFAYAWFLYGASLLLQNEEEAEDRKITDLLGTAFLFMAAFMHIFIAFLAAALYLPIKKVRHRRLSLAIGGIFLVLVSLCVLHLVLDPKPFFSGIRLGSQNWPYLVVHREYFGSDHYAEFYLFVIVVVAAGIAMAFVREKLWLSWSLVLGFLALMSPLWVAFWSDARLEGSFTSRLPQNATLIFPLVVAVAFHYRGSRWFNYFGNSVLSLAALVLCVKLFLVPSASVISGPSMPVEAIADHQHILKAWIPSSAFVRAPSGVQFRVTYFLGNRSAYSRIPVGPGETYYVVAEKQADDSCPDIQSLTVATISNSTCVSLDRSWVIRRKIF
jgi:hypothetical protein